MKLRPLTFTDEKQRETQFVPRSKHSVSVTESSHLMLCREIIDANHIVMHSAGRMWNCLMLNLIVPEGLTVFIKSALVAVNSEFRVLVALTPRK